ncbi:FAD-dependent 5-carboxymethylaminomethyl-2-thiouridine(34) oxidoreductase MnmC [Cellvibrio sp. KY-YJ-3]|uniref:FAD-dependent 5-carboxymethylaminomethyl-2-thiouridine(34) oxidoreductase MnmC n=1 Tax=Cellvibrio sp. KY-YJ-3 TaxID=454662 RepID=UPI001244A787|nr:FAD-dependent 5-carboxymethylaminomethyl-2-thiouridine(34) oxidoreductase MnmC [Cellvibrio sp. KY-YJ-3]QEY12675.1 bifunctional tRNA (5-methylaminomethyl-2-thiouridine)(34)-methyltransferase MnmD/FAD-dependent 5-carboxymethylaminomethyl-2-thiouridine(34) oxidoreductase MnmC [Cellvibrio sp. KY-YJ-3]
MTDTIHHAQLEWDEEGQPLSSAFGDVYFSRANGLEETRHVFLHHNQLTARWQQLTAGDHFTIAETGFGSGLNFLAAWELWLQTAPTTAQLHFVTVEKFPLAKPDLQRALSLWPELTELSTQLLAAYPVFVGTGIHRLRFMDGRITLSLIINDAAVGFQQLLATSHPLFANRCAKIDAWFLDGFAPSKNPQMWSDGLFTAIGQLSKPGTTAATFSAAGIVKQGLKLAGFSIQKVPGFGRKREMVKAIQHEPFVLPVSDLALARSYSPFPVPWTIVETLTESISKTIPEAITEEQTPSPKTALIIGGGLAGCTSARALAERGWQVALIERHAQLAQEASGNPQGVLYAKLSHKQETQAEFNLSALQFALGFYQPRWTQIGAQCGVLQLAHSEAEQQLQHQLRERFAQASPLAEFVGAEQASVIAGVPLQHAGLYFPQAGWINPRRLCESLVDHPAIRILNQSEAMDLTRGENLWQARDAQGELIAQAPVAVIANARDAKQFSYTSALPLKAIRGQVTYLPQGKKSQALKTVICSEGYIAPAEQGMHCTGATFNLNDDERVPRAVDHQTNLDNLRVPLADVCDDWQDLTLDELQGRVAFRCTVPDYLPLVGPVADDQAMRERFAPLRKNARAPVHLPGCYHQSLFINIGHGSRGLAYTPLCAELLAAQINNEVLPLPRELANALNPARFLIRDLIKNR